MKLLAIEFKISWNLKKKNIISQLYNGGRNIWILELLEILGDID